MTRVPITITFSLDSRVLYQRRTVREFFTTAAEIGGMYDFMILLLTGLILPVSEHLNLMQMISKLYFVEEKSS